MMATATESSVPVWIEFFHAISLWAILIPAIAGLLVGIVKKDWVIGAVSAMIGLAGILIGFTLYLIVDRIMGAFGSIPTVSYVPGVSNPAPKELNLDPTLFITIGSIAASLFGSWIGFTAEIPAYQDDKHIHGLKVAKNTAKGTSRWAGKRDIRRIAEFGDPVPKKGGTIVGKLNDELVRLMPDKIRPPLPQHAVVVAGTGAGKSYSFVIPNVIAAAEDGESLVLTDPKGELALTLAPWLQSKGYKIYIFNLAYPEWSMYWNPILECKDDEEITAFATAIVKNAGADRSGYFVAKEIQLLKAITYLLKYAFPPEQAHLRSALSLLTWSPEALDDLFVKAYTQGVELPDPKDPTHTIISKLPREGYEEWRSAVSANFDNAVSGITSKLTVIRTEPIARLLSKQEIDLSALGKEKAALFAILPVGSSHLKPILATFYYFLFRRLYGLASYHGGKLPNKTRFLLDEFANIGEIPGFTEIISTARSLGIKVQIVLQSLKQLNNTYGSAEAEAILSNCPIQLFLGGDDMSTTQYFSSRLGDGAVYVTNERRDLSEPYKTYTESTVKRPLMLPEELSQMDPLDAVCLVRWSLPLYLRKTDWIAMKQAKEILELQVDSIAAIAPHRSDSDKSLSLPSMPAIDEELAALQVELNVEREETKTSASNKTIEEKPKADKDDIISRELGL